MQRLFFFFPHAVISQWPGSSRLLIKSGLFSMPGPCWPCGPLDVLVGALLDALNRSCLFVSGRDRRFRYTYTTLSQMVQEKDFLRRLAQERTGGGRE
jgi:hypothetical protein